MHIQFSKTFDRFLMDDEQKIPSQGPVLAFEFSGANGSLAWLERSTDRLPVEKSAGNFEIERSRVQISSGPFLLFSKLIS